MEHLRPFFKGFGSKYRNTQRGIYPSPLYKTIIEPFARTGSYSLYHYKDKDIILNDLDCNIVEIWNYLKTECSKEIDYLKTIYNNDDEFYNERIVDLKCSDGAKKLIYACGHVSLNISLNARVWTEFNKNRDCSAWGKNYKNRIENQLPYLERFKICNVDYRLLDTSVICTWFIDPPYQTQNDYRHKVNFDELCEWILKLKGQIIVCENSESTWINKLLDNGFELHNAKRVNYKLGSKEEIFLTKITE